jgi:hypothetical protein
VTSTDLFMCIGVVVPALLILILTRGRLGYQPSQEQAVGPGDTPNGEDERSHVSSGTEKGGVAV